MKKQKKYYVFCPICGARVCRSASLEDTELTCPECKTDFVANYRNSILTIREAKMSYEVD